MLGGHLPELVIVLVVALLIFGPKKLPEMGSAIGKSIKEFRKGVNEISNTAAPKEAELSAPKERETLPKRDTAIESTAQASEEVSAEKRVD